MLCFHVETRAPGTREASALNGRSQVTDGIRLPFGMQAGLRQDRGVHSRRSTRKVALVLHLTTSFTLLGTQSDASVAAACLHGGTKAILLRLARQSAVQLSPFS